MWGPWVVLAVPAAVRAVIRGNGAPGLARPNEGILITVHTCMHTCMYAHMYVYAYAYMCIYIPYVGILVRLRGPRASGSAFLQDQSPYRATRYGGPSWDNCAYMLVRTHTCTSRRPGCPTSRVCMRPQRRTAMPYAKGYRAIIWKGGEGGGGGLRTPARRPKERAPLRVQRDGPPAVSFRARARERGREGGREGGRERERERATGFAEPRGPLSNGGEVRAPVPTRSRVSPQR